MGRIASPSMVGTEKTIVEILEEKQNDPREFFEHSVQSGRAENGNETLFYIR